MANDKKQRNIFVTPKGIAVYPHLNEPDEYEGKKTYKVTLRIPLEAAAGLKQQIDEAVDAAWDELIKGVKPDARKKMSKYFPYEEEYDEEENPTGNLLFKFSKNGEFKDKKTGKIIETTVPMVDAKKKPMTDKVWGGSELKIAFFMFPFKNDASRSIGVSLKIQAVQVINLVTGNSGNAGQFFDEEDGYEADATDENGFRDESEETSSAEDDGSGDF